MIFKFCIASNKFYQIWRHKHIHWVVSWKIEKTNISFLVTKRGQFLNLTTIFFTSESKNDILIHFSMILSTYFFMVRSHGFDGLFGAFVLAWKATSTRMWKIFFSSGTSYFLWKLLNFTELKPFENLLNIIDCKQISFKKMLRLHKACNIFSS